MKKVALIELGNSHTECLPSQITFLSEALIEVTLICSEYLRPRVEHFIGVTHFIFIQNDNWYDFPVFQVRKAIVKNSFDSIVFNTFHGKSIRKLFLLPLGKQNFVGIIHNIRKIKHSRTQKAINRKVHKFFTLAEYLIDHNNLQTIKSVNFEYFYAINFDLNKVNELDKPKDQVWIAIPGQVEYKRRDYDTLFKQIKEIGLSPNIHFYFLGQSMHSHGDGQSVKGEIQKLKIQNQCTLWDGFVPDDEFHSILNQCDYILPLIHKDNPELKTYFESQISGTINIAFGYHKAMLLEENYIGYPDFKEGSIFYRQKNLIETINNLNPAMVLVYKEERYNFKELQGRYLQLLQKKGI